MVVPIMPPIPIISPLNDTLEAGVPVQVALCPLPDQPVPDASQYPVVTSILVKLPRVVVNVPPFMKFFSPKSILPAVIVTPSLVKEFPLPVISLLFHVTVMVAGVTVTEQFPLTPLPSFASA